MKPTNMIEEFYENREIFITGGSGVVGKGIRKERNKAEERLKLVKESKIFNVLKLVKPNELDKLTAIPGDIMSPLLGISEANLKVIQNVSIFIHSAATVRFDEPLRKAIRVNIGGTYESMKVAQTLNNLEIFAHVSTFYSNPYLKYVDSKLYPPVMDWKTVLKLANSNIPDEVIDILTIKYTSMFPNTYTFTKSLAEHVVNEHRHLFPTLIYRPSIVIFSLKEPEPGFVDSYYGLTGITTANGTGLMRTLYGYKNIRLDKCPLDIGTKVLLLQVFKEAKTKISYVPREETKVAMFSSTMVDRTTMLEEVRLGKEVYRSWEKNPFNKTVWYPGLKVTNLLLRLFGIQPVVMSIQRKLFLAIRSMEHFVFNVYESPGITDMDLLLNISAKTSFAFPEVKSCLNERTKKRVYNLFTISSKKFILNEDSKHLNKARIWIKFLKYLDLFTHWYIRYWIAKHVLIFIYNYIKAQLPLESL
uniref:Fatty acyl-CoA reductase n=1 Tax=Megaselia scalaris TaxID=36166 RepID=T1GDJ6_MEGSC